MVAAWPQRQLPQAAVPRDNETLALIPRLQKPEALNPSHAAAERELGHVSWGPESVIPHLVGGVKVRLPVCSGAANPQSGEQCRQAGRAAQSIQTARHPTLRAPEPHKRLQGRCECGGARGESLREQQQERCERSLKGATTFPPQLTWRTAWAPPPAHMSCAETGLGLCALCE